MIEDATGELTEEAVFNDLTDYLFALFDDADDLPGFPGSENQERFIELHDLRKVTLALTALIARGNEQSQHLARRMVRKLLIALDENGAIHLGRPLSPIFSERTYRWG